MPQAATLTFKHNIRKNKQLIFELTKTLDFGILYDMGVGGDQNDVSLGLFSICRPREATNPI